MLLSKIKDYKLRKNFLKFEYKIKIKKFVFINLLSKLSFLNKKRGDESQPFYLKTIYLKNERRLFLKSKIKIIKRCLINDRTRNVYKPYNISRSVFRDLLQFGLVPGYKKAVW